MNANSLKQNITVIKEIMFFLAATLVGSIGGDLVYRKVAAKVLSVNSVRRQFVTLSVHLLKQHDRRDVQRRAGSLALAELLLADFVSVS